MMKKYYQYWQNFITVTVDIQLAKTTYENKIMQETCCAKKRHQTKLKCSEIAQ
jgi:hypothetical protein